MNDGAKRSIEADLVTRVGETAVDEEVAVAVSAGELEHRGGPTDEVNRSLDRQGPAGQLHERVGRGVVGRQPVVRVAAGRRSHHPVIHERSHRPLRARKTEPEDLGQLGEAETLRPLIEDQRHLACSKVHDRCHHGEDTTRIA